MSYTLGKGKDETTYGLIDDEGKTNISGLSNKKNEMDRVNREEIMYSVGTYNKYYKNSENDFNVTRAFNKFPDKYAQESSLGRVDGVGDKYIPAFHSNQQNENEIYNNFLSDSIKGNFEQNDLSKHFFSEHNVEGIQRGIKKEVYNLSNGNFKIDHQSENAIKTVMRSYFLQHKIENNKSILTQINDINRLIIVWCADNIYSNLLQYQQYKKDITTLPQQMARPLNMSIKGSYQFDLSKRNDMRNKY